MRVADFAPFLREHRIDLTYRPMLRDAEYSLLSAAASPAAKVSVLARSALRAAASTRLDGLLMVHRLMLLTPLPGVDPPRRLDVYDLDDALFVGSAAEVNRRFQWVKQEARRATMAARRARLVIAANPTLAAQARELAGRVEIVPSCVDPSIQPLRQHGDVEEVAIGWIGSQTTAAYLEPIMPVIERLNSEGLRARLVVVGGDRRVQAEWLEHRDWTQASQASDLASFDIGIMPLPDDPWARGKSGYKLLQYFAAGVPAVASPVGVNRELIADGRGLSADTAEQWYEALRELIADPVARGQRGLAARKFVEDHYSYQRWAPELAQLLRSLS